MDIDWNEKISSILQQLQAVAFPSRPYCGPPCSVMATPWCCWLQSLVAQLQLLDVFHLVQPLLLQASDVSILNLLCFIIYWFTK